VPTTKRSDLKFINASNKRNELNDKSSIGQTFGAATQTGGCDPGTNANSAKRIGSARRWAKCLWEEIRRPA
jgi:hypothetical protein